jgi:peptide/nickel transport system ATP-binding protein
VSSLAIMGLLPSTAQITGSIEFEGQSLLGLDDAACRDPRQRPRDGLPGPAVGAHPVYTVGDQIAEALRLHDRTCRQAPRPARSSC